MGISIKINSPIKTRTVALLAAIVGLLGEACTSTNTNQNTDWPIQFSVDEAELRARNKEVDCLEFIGLLLPVMTDGRMQALANDRRIYDKGGSILLVNQIKTLSDEGDPNALYSLGMLYENGYCEPKDEKKGFLYTRRQLNEEAKKRGNDLANEIANSAVDTQQTSRKWFVSK